MQIPIQNDIVGEAKLIVQEIAKILSVHRRLPVDLDNNGFQFWTKVYFFEKID